MALDTGIVRLHEVEPGRVDDRLADRVFNMLACRAVTSFTADIPLGHLMSRNVVIDRMAAVAELAGRPLIIVRREQRRPPVGAVLDEIRRPFFVSDVPLSR